MLFGSFVRGEHTASSDIDLLVEFAPEKHTFDNFMDVSFLLEEILGRRVEVVTPEGLSPHIGPHILKEVERVVGGVELKKDKMHKDIDITCYVSAFSWQFMVGGLSEADLKTQSWFDVKSTIELLPED